MTLGEKSQSRISAQPSGKPSEVAVTDQLIVINPPKQEDGTRCLLDACASHPAPSAFEIASHIGFFSI